uniref:Caspase-8 n=1 Tax=Lutzomyia longipalpis TaxID=7200 RepID=A0A1B0GLN8_LUTLO
MARISLEDLELLEKDLLFYEKVSVCFLLLRGQRDLNFLLEKLITAFKINRIGRLEDTKIITPWARSDPDYKWREHLVEALAIVKSNKVLKKLGFELSDLQETYHPHIDEFSVHVHPILKILYRMCEKMPRNGRQRLIQHIRNDCQDFINVGVDAEDFLEIYFLSWIQLKIISIGDKSGLGAQIDKVLEFLKVNEMDEFYDKLTKFTATSLDATVQEGSSPVRPKQPPKNNEMKEINEENYFQMNPDAMGYVVIVNEKNFHRDPLRIVETSFLQRDLETRHGTEKDVESLRETFSALGFSVIVKDDLTSDEILTSLAEYVEKTASRSFSSLIIVMLSHGFEGSIYGSNSIPVEIRRIKEALYCEKLKDIPKILIIQACQNNDAFLNGKLTIDAAPSVDAAANLLVAFSTVEGFVSIRHTTEGTWFIQILCSKIRQLYKKEHFGDILTKVTCEVAAQIGDGGQKMMPKYESTLLKNLYFFPQ